MKPEFKMIIFIGIGLFLLLVGLYYGQFDKITHWINAKPSGGTFGIPTK